MKDRWMTALFITLVIIFASATTTFAESHGKIRDTSTSYHPDTHGMIRADSTENQPADHGTTR
jgi:hypothetical protein